MKVREVIKLVEADGWILVRTRGSHRQYHHPNKPGTAMVLETYLMLYPLDCSTVF